MSESRKRLGILQAGHAPEELIDSHPDYHQMFQRLLGETSFEYETWAVVDGEMPDSITDADAWLITGSRYGVYEDHAWIKPLESFIRQLYAAKIPLVGICFGHQIIAQALGGDVKKFAGGWSVGRVEYELDSSVFNTSSVTLTEAQETSGANTTSATSNPTALLTYHQDQVINPPASARTVGQTDFCQHAALVYGDSILTLQPHPEFDDSFITGLLETRGKVIPAEIREQAALSLNKPIAREPIAAVLRKFLQRP